MAPIDLSKIELKAILFDIDGTLVESDPLHLQAFNDTMVKYGVPAVTEAFFWSTVAGNHNPTLLATMFPHWSQEKVYQVDWDKEARFRELAASKLEATKGLNDICSWIDEKGLKKSCGNQFPSNQCRNDVERDWQKGVL
eukprot:TRINITY_DN3233_c1_g1_i1.p2 TRINITY_DN3233_c1_g1~~TRINITY_DN3233_c1_g1_i1.p2  ORF type:complete len:149 (+),score=24.10 TRINITY_DN3233_c1_g1_i1:33-449(+)